MINVADSEAHRQDRRRASRDAVSNANIQTAQQLKMDAMRFHERKTFATTEEDLEQDSADVPVVMHGQVPVLRRQREQWTNHWSNTLT